MKALSLVIAMSRHWVMVGAFGSSALLATSLPAFAQVQKNTFEQGRPRTEHPKLLRAVRWTAIAAASLDSSYSVYISAHHLTNEGDPIAKPIANLPTPAYAICDAVLIALGYFASVKMEHNRHPAIRRGAWILPIVTGLANGIAFAHTVKTNAQCNPAQYYCL